MGLPQKVLAFYLTLSFLAVLIRILTQPSKMTATGWGCYPNAQTILAVKEDGWQTMLVDSFLREWSNVQASTADLKQLSGLALLRQLLPNEFARQLIYIYIYIHTH